MSEINLFRNAGAHRDLVAGEVLFEVGDEAADMYGVMSGTIELFRDDSVIESVGPGGVFGEVGILGARHRSAGARAATDARVAVVDEKEFLRLVKLNPYFALEVMRIMAGRLQATA